MSAFCRMDEHDTQWGMNQGVALVNECIRADIKEGDRPKCNSDEKQHAARIENNQSGACGELACCRWAGVLWLAPINAHITGDSDILGEIEVRSKLPSRNFMALRGSDERKPYSIFVSMTRMERDRFDVWRVDGWEWGVIIMSNPKVKHKYESNLKEEWEWSEDKMRDDISLLEEINARYEIGKRGRRLGQQWMVQQMKKRFEEAVGFEAARQYKRRFDEVVGYGFGHAA